VPKNLLEAAVEQVHLQWECIARLVVVEVRKVDLDTDHQHILCIHINDLHTLSATGSLNKGRPIFFASSAASVDFPA
jgi:hypothetical protein